MMNTQINTKQIISSSKKLLEDNKAIRAYLKGELTLAALNERGIKFTMPI